MVTHEYSVDWEHYECSAHGLIIVYVDTRGSGGRGDDWTFSIYKNLGTLEVEDTITVAKYVLSLIMFFVPIIHIIHVIHVCIT
jgi:dipeptidyl-peptidase-4